MEYTLLFSTILKLGLAQDPLLEVPELPEATASYDLTVELDPATKTIRGEGTVRWVHRGEGPVVALWWHLYLNAFRNEASTFIRESGGRLRGDEMEEDSWGWTEVTRMSARDADLLAEASFESPDDGNPDDRTVLKTPLPFALQPGEEVQIQVAFTAKLPKVFARTGYGGSFFLVAQWFPKLGVLESSYRDRPRSRWNVHQFHASSEFFADYGDYRVEITVPEDHVVGATGVRESERIEAGQKTVVYTQNGVHDFAWTADPRFVEEQVLFGPDDVPPESVEEAAQLLGVAAEKLRIPSVQVRLLLQPEHVMFADRYRKAIFASLQWFSLLYGPYPYPTLTLVDGPRQARGAMGMEYPTFITGGVRWPQPADSASPELVTVHEFGHQYWYGLVATNEFEEAWMDEGFNTYSTAWVLDRVYGARVFSPSFLGLPLTPWVSGTDLDQGAFLHMTRLRTPDMDPIVQAAWRYRNDGSYGVNSYSRPALFLRQVEATLGTSTFARAMRRYALKYRFRHPNTEDFLAVLDEVADEPISERLRPLLYEPGALNYAVDALKSTPIRPNQGVFERTDPDDPTEHRVVTSSVTEGEFEGPYRTEVVVTREAPKVWPVTLEVAFEDGERIRQTWDGMGRWHRFEFIRDTKAEWARIHPDGQVPLDTSRVDDSLRAKPDPLPGKVWGSHATYLLQTALQLVGGLL